MCVLRTKISDNKLIVSQALQNENFETYITIVEFLKTQKFRITKNKCLRYKSGRKQYLEVIAPGLQFRKTDKILHYKINNVQSVRFKSSISHFWEQFSKIEP